MIDPKVMIIRLRVRFEIDEKELDSYRRAADFLNINNVEVVSVQHEFGIYGGPAGSHLLAFLRDVHMPVVTTLHTVLQEPNPDQRVVMKQLDILSNRFIVMADRGKRFLEEIYGIARRKDRRDPAWDTGHPFYRSKL